MNCWIAGFHNRGIKEAILKLQDEGVITIAEWTARNEHATLSDFDFKHLHFEEQKETPCAMPFYQTLFDDYFPIFRLTYERTPATMGSQPGEAENAFWIYAHFILKRLKEKK